MRIWNWQ